LPKDTNLEAKVGIFRRKNFLVFVRSYFVYDVYWTKISALELFFVHLLRDPPLKDGLPQIDKYLSGLSLNTGWLVIFDRRSGLPPISDRTTTKNVISPAGREIIVIRG
jgi:hypothetical protein